MKTNSLPPKKLYPGRLKSLLLLLVMLLGLGTGIWMITDGADKGWFVAIATGIGLLVAIVNILPQASYLILNEDGFESCSMFKKHAYRWEDVGPFGVGSIANNKMVMFNFSPDYRKAKQGRKLASAISGAEGALHDTFGLKAKNLAKLMNEYRDFYLGN